MHLMSVKNTFYIFESVMQLYSNSNDEVGSELVQVSSL